MTAPRFPRPLAAALFGLYAAWSFVVPIYEAPDERPGGVEREQRRSE